MLATAFTEQTQRNPKNFGVRFLVIVEGRATKEGRQKKTGRTKKEAEKQESKKSKFDPYTL